MRALIRILIGILIAAGIIAVLVYLFRGRSAPTEPDLGIDLQQIIPTAWTPWGDGLISINIDDTDPDNPDPGEEYLLFYTYDGGQLGGVIYDPQTTPRGNTSFAIPQLPSAYLVPYLLLPDYIRGKTNGYLGNVYLDYQTFAADSPNGQANQMAVRGYNFWNSDAGVGSINRFSLFWWKDAADGYGGAQANTTGSLSQSYTTPNDWSGWTAGNYNIDELWAWEPLGDRSNICQRRHWQLIASEEFPLQRQFVSTNYGNLIFCTGNPPATPAFPEGQVLAYLLDGNRDRLANEDDASIPTFTNVIVDRISYPGNLMPLADETTASAEPIIVSVDTDFSSGGEELSMTWYVEMVRPDTIQSTVSWQIVSLEAR